MFAAGTVIPIGIDAPVMSVRSSAPHAKRATSPNAAARSTPAAHATGSRRGACPGSSLERQRLASQPRARGKATSTRFLAVIARGTALQVTRYPAASRR